MERRGSDEAAQRNGQKNPPHPAVNVNVNADRGATVNGPVLAGNSIQSFSYISTPGAVAQPVQEESRNDPVSVREQPIQADWKRPNIIPCSQEFKDKILREKGDEIYIPKDKSQRKRLALLITNIEFFNKEYNRIGAERDEENMEWLLRALGYSVQKHTDLTGEDIHTDTGVVNPNTVYLQRCRVSQVNIVEILECKQIKDAVRNFSKRSEHKDSDSTFVVIMSHGKRINNKDAILGVNYHQDQNPVDYFCVDDIFTHLNSQNCSALIDKPKVILIQACRGGHTGAVEIQSDGAVHIERDAVVHIEKDFVCFKSCLPDISAYRDPVHGSYFIMYILQVFCEQAHTDDIMELFRKVTSRMEKDPRFKHLKIYEGGRFIGLAKLMPCIDRTSLPKKLYLFPGL